MTIATSAITIKRWAILDSNVTSHFLTTDAPAANILPAVIPLVARLPNGDKVHSTRTCTLDLQDLPPGAQEAHIIPGLATHPLLSVITMCNGGCTVTFTKISCTIVYRGRIIVCGHKCTRTGLWMVPLSKQQQASSPASTFPPTVPTSTLAANVDATSSAAKYARYIHHTAAKMTQF